MITKLKLYFHYFINLKAFGNKRRALDARISFNDLADPFSSCLKGKLGPTSVRVDTLTNDPFGSNALLSILFRNESVIFLPEGNAL